jgi:hypothetical protein
MFPAEYPNMEQPVKVSRKQMDAQDASTQKNDTNDGDFDFMMWEK